MKPKKIYAIENELIMSKWDFNENEKEYIYPENILKGSHKKVHFICPNCKEKWVREIRREFISNGCPSCGGKEKVKHWMKTKLKNTKSLFITNPELKKEWDYEKNNSEGLDPNFLTAGSNKKANWICPLGHPYKAYIVNRTTKNTGCRFCAGQDVLKGFNDLQSQNPKLAKEWSEKNTILPSEVTTHSKQKVYWICPLGHDDYLMSVYHRSIRQGCPICSQQSQTSFPEQAIYFYVKQIFADVINRYIQDNKEIDIFIPSKKIGIEYNGYFSHKNKLEKDLNKKNYFEAKKIKMIIVKEYKKNDEKCNADFYINERTSYSDLNELIKEILNFICPNHSLNIDCEKDFIKIEEQYIFLKKQNSIGVLYPEISKEWDYNKNGKIKPEFVSYCSQKKYYWICPNMHSYACSPKNRVEGRGCQICSGIRYVKNVNDLKTKYPNLVKYWDYDLNDVDPSDIKFSDSNEHWWKCDKGHSYKTTIKTMLKYNECLGCLKNVKMLIKGVNDLATLNPALINEWDYENNDKTPDCYTLNSNKEVWWKCRVCGYSYKSQINQKKHCPNCKKKLSIINVYLIETGEKIYTFSDIKELCNTMNINYDKQHGNITSICYRKQKTLNNKYILRYNETDEFKNLDNLQRKDVINKFLNNK